MIDFFQLGILGMTGQGKSYLTSQLINYLVKYYNRIVIIDDLNQIPFSNAIICNTISEFIQNVVNKNNFIVICRFYNMNDYNLAFQVIWLLKSSLLVIDELSLFCDPVRISESLRNISQRGRLKNISFIWNTQRPANISRNISSQTEFIISFKLSELSDLRYFYYDKTKLLKIQTLSKFHYTLLRGDPCELKNKLKNYKFNLTF